MPTDGSLCTVGTTVYFCSESARERPRDPYIPLRQGAPVKREIAPSTCGVAKGTELIMDHSCSGTYHLASKINSDIKSDCRF